MKITQSLRFSSAPQLHKNGDCGTFLTIAEMRLVAKRAGNHTSIGAMFSSAFSMVPAVAVTALLSATFASGSWAAGIDTTGPDSAHDVASKEYAEAPYVKPGAPVRLVSPAVFELFAGDVLPIELELATHPIGLTTVSLSSDSGVVINGRRTYQLQDQKRIVMPLEVTAESSGLGYIHLHVEHRSVTGQVTARALAVAIDSRSQLLPLQRKASKTQSYIEMQATEVIR